MEETENDKKQPIKNKIKEIHNQFKLPITYVKADKLQTVAPHIIDNLELIETAEPTGSPLYTFCFDNDNDVSRELNRQIVKHYTTDIAYLKDTQKLLKEYVPLPEKYTDYSSNYSKIVDIWTELTLDMEFKERYYYVEWDMLAFLNRSEWFLQAMSIYNLMSPVISLMVPIIILIIPFFVLKMRGISLSITEYVDVLKMVASQNAIGKLFVVNFGEISVQEKMSIFISAVFYIFSIYQNFMVCSRFNNNMKTIHNHFSEIRIYLEHSIASMEHYLEFAKNLMSYSNFNEMVLNRLNDLKRLREKIQCITDYNMFNIGKIREIGYVFKCFYELHVDTEYNNSFIYSLGFNGFIDCIRGLQYNLTNGYMNYAKLAPDGSKKEMVFKDSYYACLKRESPTKNTVKLHTNMTITGPNASGKTTILKSTLINIMMSQQFGCGFYSNAYVNPVKHIHCYLNIPDTSGRDSLFQAEARRCKDILDAIAREPNERHFCAFDELYSGTNPEEAEKSATAFMQYLSRNPNVKCMLTTHFIKTCKKLGQDSLIKNYKMSTELTNENTSQLHYTYKLVPGISTVKGGIIVLKQLNYPHEIITMTQ